MNVLIVDDHPMVMEYLTSAVGKALPEAVVRTASDLTSALELAADVPLHMVLLDLGLPGCGGLDSVVRFRKAFPNVLVLVVSSNDDQESILGALGVGAAGFVSKGAGPKVMLHALRVVASGERYIPPEALAVAAAEPAGQHGAAKKKARQ
jgi:DNA-binding NarL/FixJ family response regulator